MGKKKADKLQHEMESSFSDFVKTKVDGLQGEQLSDFYFLYSKRFRKGGLAFLCWLFGCHYLYLGGFRLLVTQILFWVTFGGFAIWYIRDLFVLKRLVQNANDDIALELITQVKQLNE